MVGEGECGVRDLFATLVGCCVSKETERSLVGTDQCVVGVGRVGWS